MLLGLHPLPARSQSLEPPEILADVRRVLQESRGIRPLVRIGPNGLLHLGLRSEGVVRALDPRTLEERVVFRGDPDRWFPSMMGWVQDELWVLDGEGMRFYGPDGRLRRESPLPSRDLGGGARAGIPEAVLPGGWLVRPTTASAEDLAASWEGWSELAARGAPAPPTTPVDRLPLLVELPDGSRREVLALYAGNRVGAFQFRGLQGHAALGLLTQPFPDDDLFHVDPGGRAVVVVERRVPREGRPAFGVHRIGLPDGDTLSSRWYSHDPMPLPTEWVDEVVRQQVGRLPEGAVQVGAVRAAIRVPPYHPPATAVLSDGEGWIWVGRERPPGAEGTLWEVLAPSGARMGKVRVPAGAELRAVRGLEAWAVEGAGTGGGWSLWHIVARPGGSPR